MDEFGSIAYLQGDTGLQAMPKGSYHSVITDMVADNVVVLENGAQVSGAGSETSLEQIALWDPELIIFGPASVYDTVADDPAWQSLSAIRTGNYYQIPNTPYDWMNRPPSVNQLLGPQWLPRICYPDKFDDDMYEVASGYYKLFYDYDMSQADFDELMAKAMPQKQIPPRTPSIARCASESPRHRGFSHFGRKPERSGRANAARLTLL